MNLQQRMNDFIFLGQVLKAAVNGDNTIIENSTVSISTLEELRIRINNTFPYNAWFTPQSIENALNGIAYMLTKDALLDWINNYPELQNKSEIKKVGIVMAGNIPLVGFHDFLCVLMSGNKAICKLSSSDDRLWPIIFQLLMEINAEYKDLIEVVPRLKDIDAVIATGSNNTSRYFDYYFAKYPHIIRKNRNSVAVLNGSESEEDLQKLAIDVFSYFGLGCRNVSKIYLPESMDINKVIAAFYSHRDIINHNKYANNFDYNKTVMLLNEDDVLENGFLLFNRSEEIASPLATLYYDYYSDYDVLMDSLADKEEQIQCIVGTAKVEFGKSQFPELTDYADGVDVMEFLVKLN